MKTNRRRWAVLAALALVVVLAAGGLLAGSALAQRGQPGGYGPGMMGSYDSGITGGCGQGYGPGMMGGYGRGYGSGMMGGYGQGYGPGMSQAPASGAGVGCNGAQINPNAKRLSSDQVQQAVTDYINRYYDGQNLTIAEIMEFQNNFYAQVKEQATGVNAFELLIDPYTGNVWPEYGPNMMWNTKYGMMGSRGMMGGFGWGRQATANMPVKPQQAVQDAQQYLSAQGTGLTAEAQPDVFYGYYTLHTLKDGKIEGMLSVNGYTGQVWYHSWHGPFIGMVGEPAEG
jgi:hypothetical protein